MNLHVFGQLKFLATLQNDEVVFTFLFSCLELITQTLLDRFLNKSAIQVHEHVFVVLEVPELFASSLNPRLSFHSMKVDSQ